MKNIILIITLLCLGLSGYAQNELAFEADQTNVCAGGEVTFTASITDADQYIWTLPGTEEENIMTTEPTVTATYYASPEDRTLDVSLTTVKDATETTTIAENFIQVAPDLANEISTVIEVDHTNCDNGTIFNVQVNTELDINDLTIEINNSRQTIDDNTFSFTCNYHPDCLFVISYEHKDFGCYSEEVRNLTNESVKKFRNIEFVNAPFFICVNEPIYINQNIMISPYIITDPDVFLGDYGNYEVEVEGAGIIVSEDGKYFSVAEAGTYQINYHFKYGKEGCEELYTRDVIVVDDLAITSNKTEYCVGDTVQFQVTDLVDYFNSLSEVWTINGEYVDSKPKIEYIITEAGIHELEALFCENPVFLEFEAKSCQTSTAIEPTKNGTFNWSIYSLPFQNTKQIQLEGLKGSENIDLNIYTLMGQKIQTTSLQPTENQTVEIPNQYANGLLIVELVVDGKHYGGKKCW